MEKNLIPYLPETAPFTAEQRAYLNGFLAGLFSRTSETPNTGSSAADHRKRQEPLTILFGSQTGNAETLARRIAKAAAGFAANVCDMAQYPAANLPAERNLLIVTSTYGDGDPPDNAKTLWEFLSADRAPALTGVRFSVLALGDSNYPKFCECGKNFDRRLAELGARRIHLRTDCDVDYEESFRDWLDRALRALADSVAPSETAPSSAQPDLRADHPRALSPCSAGNEQRTEVRLSLSAMPNVYSRKNPFPAPLLANRNLNGPGSAGETRHFEMSLNGSGLSYQAGDALAVHPSNCPILVDEIVSALGGSGDELVSSVDGSEISFRDALMRHYDITRIGRALLEAFARRTGHETLQRVTAPNANGALTQFLCGREVIDLVLEFPGGMFAPSEFVGLLKKLQPRLYSISSSPKVHSGQVHLTVAVVRYDSLGRQRKGVCSCFLAERAEPGTAVPVFVHENKNFRLPVDPVRPMIMIGPGTGIAPFRAFLHERTAVGATGKNWLFFGARHRATDFFYRDELEAMQRGGTLTRLDTAFSRDQAHKIYVQDRMLENARELFDWLEQGAHVYVCGDAKRMAKDVEETLCQVIERGGGQKGEQAFEYIARLKAEKRYQRDVY